MKILEKLEEGILTASLLTYPALRTLSLQLLSVVTGSYVSGTYSVVFVNCPNEQIARDIARAILDKKLAASVNILPKASSLYYWNGEIEEATEVLLLIKTKTSKIHMLSSYISVHGVAELDRTERLDWTLHSVMPCVVSAVQQSGSAIHVYLLFRVLSHHGLSPDTG
ncbi:protein CutA homolog isoform X3 [Budorcas taxicolor]|uniref:protein CutA homolog isoform X3 n=1 Tax=Budorcas taxicolor TaxID=37181 RepID=UPI00228423AF|nr:protein CutA homolog isoform X3 [Budorcas taxicolor]